MRLINYYSGLIFLLLLVSVLGCIAQKPLSVTFTEGGKGAGIASGLVEKTATAAPATVSSIANTIGSAVTILEFTVKENGSKDGYPLQIKELRFTNTGTGDAADFRFILEGPGSNNTVGTSTGQTVVFKDFGDIIVPDGETTGRTYQVKVHVRSNIQGTTTDNQTILLKTSPITDFDVTETSSNFLASNSQFQQSPGTAISVIATALKGKTTFFGISVSISTNFPGSPTIYAVDGSERVDTDFTGQIFLSDVQDCALEDDGPGALSSVLKGVTPNAVAGVVIWTDLRYSAATSNLHVLAQAAGLIKFCSAQITVTP